MSKLFGVETSFTNYRKTAKPGYLSSTQYDIITGTHAVSITKGQDKALYRPGRAVYLHDFSVVDGCGEVSILNDPSQTPFGVLSMSHAYTPSGLFNDGDIANVITFGCVYMICSSNIEMEKVTYGKQVSIMRDWGSVINSDNMKIPASSMIRTRWYFTGAIEFGVKDERFGLVNVAEVMCVPGSIITNQGTDEEPKIMGHRKIGDQSWYGFGSTYLLPTVEVANNKKVEFEFFVNTVEAMKASFNGDAAKLADVKEVQRVSFTYNLDPTRTSDAIVSLLSSDPAINTSIDTSDGIGRATGKFTVTRRQYDEKVPTWCVAIVAYRVRFNDAKKYPDENISASFMVRLEV